MAKYEVMSEYKRLTSDTGFARNLPINEKLYDRLYGLENAIENGTLIFNTDDTVGAKEYQNMKEDKTINKEVRDLHVVYRYGDGLSSITIPGISRTIVDAKGRASLEDENDIARYIAALMSLKCKSFIPGTSIQILSIEEGPIYVY